MRRAPKDLIDVFVHCAEAWGHPSADFEKPFPHGGFGVYSCAPSAPQASLKRGCRRRCRFRPLLPCGLAGLGYMKRRS